MTVTLHKNIVQLFPTITGEVPNPLPPLELLGFQVSSAEADFLPQGAQNYCGSQYRINYREDNLKDLGICKGQYRIIQNSRIFINFGKMYTFNQK